MKIVCAQSVTGGREAFAGLGEVEVLPDRGMGKEDLRDADALIVRSKTRVGRELLEGTGVKFVGTATAGFDHLDTRWLDEAGIAWTASPGCNANAVAEYTVTALAGMAARRGTGLEGKTLAVVGAGNVGSRVAAKARLLGMRVLCVDPPRAARGAKDGGEDFVELAEAAEAADAVTLHVPLTDSGPHATRHLADCRLLGRMKPGAWLVNCARGAVADTEALALATESGRLGALALDVWEGEPGGMPEGLAAAADVLTPHVAGYSLEGLENGTEMCRRALAEFLEEADEAGASWAGRGGAEGGGAGEVEVSCAGLGEAETLATALEAVCPLEADTAAWRAVLAERLGAEELRRRFDAVRRGYVGRREFAAYRVRLTGGEVGGKVRGWLEGLGFALDTGTRDE